ncbi:ankyrin repeat domain-containing protein [Cohnella soli]|uniref:Ankyrin repeat domain-containing protein n=1 Tax=Cohnella soli TaxID=425005 RepID=A0ABW0HJV8_9BACL
MKRLLLILLVAVLTLPFTVTANAASQISFMKGGVRIAEAPLNVKGIYYFQVPTIEKTFGIKFKLDSKKKTATFTLPSNKSVTTDVVVNDKKSYISITKVAEALGFVVPFDKETGAYLILKKLSLKEAEEAYKSAVVEGNIAKVKELLLSGVDVNMKVKGRNVLFDLFPAVKQLGVDRARNMLNFLISKGIDVNAVNGPSFVLAEAVFSQADANLFQLLLKAGADPNKKNQYGITAIDWASSHDEADVVAMLIQYGANVNGNALPWACKEGYTDIVELLVKAGADPNMKDQYGLSVMFHAIERQHPTTVEMLLKNGADPNGSSIVAVEKGNATIIELLLKYGANPDDLLVVAEQMENASIVELLLKHGD